MAKLEAKLGMIVDKVGQFFSGSDHLPSCDSDIIAECERDFAEAEKQPSSDYSMQLQGSLLCLSCALLHSKRPEDVQRGIAMLQSSEPSTVDPLQQRENLYLMENLYLLAVGYYKSGDYTKSRDLVEKCLEIAPDWRHALTLETAISERITKDRVIKLVIAATVAATAVGLIAGGIAAAASRKR